MESSLAYFKMTLYIKLVCYRVSNCSCIESNCEKINFVHCLYKSNTFMICIDSHYHITYFFLHKFKILQYKFPMSDILRQSSFCRLFFGHYS